MNEGDSVVTLVSAGAIEAWLQIPERYLAALQEAVPRSVELRVAGRKELVEVDRSSLVPDVEGRSRLFTLIAHVSDPDSLLSPGASVEARVPVGESQKRLIVSADAVLQSYAGTYVFVPQRAGEGLPIAKRVPVEVLFERQGESVLSGGELKAGDEVIVEGNERLFPGTPLNVQPWSETREAKPAGGAS